MPARPFRLLPLEERILLDVASGLEYDQIGPKYGITPARCRAHLWLARRRNKCRNTPNLLFRYLTEERMHHV